MPTETREAVQLFIGRLVAMKSQDGHKPLDDVQFKRIASELGLTEADLQEAERVAEADLHRGLGFAGVRCWDAAIENLTNAAVLMPNDLRARHALAEAYVGRWEQQGRNGDRRMAERLVRHIVETDPLRNSAYDLLARMRDAEAEVEAKKQGKRNPVILCCIALVPVVVGIGVCLPPCPSPPATARSSHVGASHSPDNATNAHMPARKPSAWSLSR